MVMGQEECVRAHLGLVHTGRISGGIQAMCTAASPTEAGHSGGFCLRVMTEKGLPISSRSKKNKNE